MRILRPLLITSTIFLSSLSAQAGVGTSLMQTAPVLSPGAYEAKAQADVVLNHGGGFNISPHFRFGVVDNFLDVEAFFGTGTTDFQAGGVAKYNLLPDVEGQLGLSFLGGLSYLHDNKGPDSFNDALMTLTVLASKDMAVDFGTLTPYGAFQVEARIGSVDSTVPLTLLAGARWKPSSTSPWHFYSELSADLHDSNWGVALGAGYPF